MNEEGRAAQMKYLIWGTGYQADVVYRSNCSKFKEWDIDIVGFVDNSRKSDLFHNIRVYSPNEIALLDYDYIDIWVINEGLREIQYQIQNELGIPSEKIKNAFENVIKVLSQHYESYSVYERPSAELFSACVDYYRSHQWYKSIYSNFEKDKRAFYVYEWVKNNLCINTRILDIACGAGELLFHLHQEGYQKLSGFDIDETSIFAAKDLNSITHGNIHFFINNALKPIFLEKYDVLVWMAGLYLFENYSLDCFFAEYVRRINENGYLIFEMVDASYNEIPLNEFHTADWKNSGKKRPSEYQLRMSKKEVLFCAQRHHLRLIKIYNVKNLVPFKIYIFQR